MSSHILEGIQPYKNTAPCCCSYIAFHGTGCVDVPIHSLCDHHDVTMFGRRNGISYRNITAEKKS